MSSASQQETRPLPSVTEQTSAVTDPVFRRLRKRIMFLSALLVLTLALITWKVVNHAQQTVIRHQAVKLAEVISSFAANARTVYTDRIVHKLQDDGFGAHPHSQDRKGFVPLPAQFLKMLGEYSIVDNEGFYNYRLVSKWNLSGANILNDPFLRWAWAKLEAQDQANPSEPIQWQSAWRIDTMNDEHVLRFLRADPAINQTCVHCHNRMEQKPEIIALRKQQGITPSRQWKTHQLLGAIEVNIPLGKVEAVATSQRNLALYSVLGVLLLGMSTIGGFMFIDIKRARGMARKLSWHVNHDNLTGLLNRTAFDSRLKELLNDVKKSKHTHTLLLVDLDQFKLVNDTCGHMAGDELLKQITYFLTPMIRGTDMLARLGGDEFGIILEDCPIKQAKLVAKKVLSAIRRFKFIWGDTSFQVNASIGMVPLTGNSKDTSSLMSALDMACYAAKEEGRDQIYALLDSGDEFDQRQQEMGWVSRIEDAMANGHLKLAVQKAIATRADASIKNYYEILLRMFDEKGEPLPTPLIIQSAERYNYMTQVDKWVTSTTLEYLNEGCLDIEKDSIVAINLSGTSINNKAFLEYIGQLFKAFPNIPPSMICFEVTETAAIQHIERAKDFIESLKQIGCQFALDDFGSGVSSFNYLKNLNVDFLKIDGAFIHNILNDPVDKTMVSSIVQIGDALNIPSIAEWVEDEAIMECIKELGVGYAQGYHISKPQIIDR